jgi:cytochrome c biogenesis protein CcdA
VSDQTPIPSYSAPANEPAASAASVGPAPQQVNIAFWLYLVGALLSLVSLVISAATAGATKTTLQNQLSAQGQHLSDSTLSALVAFSVGVAVVFGIVFIVAYVLFALFMRRGANWARILLLILTVLSLFQILSGSGIGAGRFAVGAVATILIFLRPANEYFRAVKANKLANRR